MPVKPALTDVPALDLEADLSVFNQQNIGYQGQGDIKSTQLSERWSFSSYALRSTAISRSR